MDKRTALGRTAGAVALFGALVGTVITVDTASAGPDERCAQALQAWGDAIGMSRVVFDQGDYAASSSWLRHAVSAQDDYRMLGCEEPQP